MRNIKALCCILIIGSLMLSGCSQLVESTVNQAAGVVGQTAGQQVGQTVGTALGGYAEASLRNLSPALMQLYVSTLFSAFFYSGGYDFAHHDYKPGEWSRWQATGMDEGNEFEKAFLKRTDDGKQWWQIVASAVRDGKTEVVVLEALFSPTDEAGMRNLLRLRSLFPGDTMPAEIPVQENTAAWYHAPIKLTADSLEAATTGTEQISTPAGTFNARHVAYRDVSGRAEWWLSEDVPGGIVKYTSTTAEQSQPRYTAELIAFGKAAQSRLQSF